MRHEWPRDPGFQLLLKARLSVLGFTRLVTGTNCEKCLVSITVHRLACPVFTSAYLCYNTYLGILSSEKPSSGSAGTQGRVELSWCGQHHWRLCGDQSHWGGGGYSGKCGRSPEERRHALSLAGRPQSCSPYGVQAADCWKCTSHGDIP